MEQQMPENMRVLRLFGAEKAALATLFAQAENNKGVRIQSVEQGNEMLILLEAVTRSGSATSAVLNGWQEQISSHSVGALYGTGEVTLPQATVDILKKNDVLFACADAQTSALIEAKLEKIKTLEKVYDFGAHSHAHPKFGRKIAMGAKFASKYPDQTAQQVAGRVKAGYQYSGANYILSILPLEDGSHLVMLGEKARYWLRRVPAEQSVVLWAMDILRRAAAELPQAKGTVQLAYGASMPAFAVVKSIADKDEDFIAPAQEEFDAPPPPQAAHKAGRGVGVAIVWMLIFALLAIAALYLYTGGDIASLWNDSGLGRYNVSSATLLALVR